MNRFFYTLTVGCLSLMIVSCTGEKVDYSEPTVTPPALPAPEVTQLPTELPDVVSPDCASAPLNSISSAAVEHMNDFSLRFYLANSKNGHENLCVSPLSVGSVLGMIANGDDGEARDEVLRILGFEESSVGLKALNVYYQTLLSNFPNIEEDVSFFATNTLWCDPSIYRIRKSFMETISDFYYAYGIGISPSGEDGKNAINEFVGKNTNGLINEFLTSPLEVKLAFLNTIYFKAGWTIGFDKDMTDKMTFFDIDGKEQLTDFMWSRYVTEYGVTEDGTEAIRLNYGKYRQFSMTCVLPSSDINHVALDEVLTVDNINSINKSMKEEDMIVMLPKFEIETNNPNTIDILKALGLNTAANFSLITDSNNLYLDLFVHATKIKVDENGTEGAAVSLGGMDVSLAPGEEANSVRKIVFDRPFIFYIQENTTGALLFIGSVKTFS